MDIGLQNYIIAAVSMDSEKVKGAFPFFLAESPEEQQRISLLIARIMGGIVHDLENGVYIVVKH